MSPPSFPARALLALVRAYQLVLSPFLGGRCRFEPSCSKYAAACLVDHGAWRGSLLSVVRLCKCHPFHPGGFDLPPPRLPGSSGSVLGALNTAAGAHLPPPADPAQRPPSLSPQQ